MKYFQAVIVLIFCILIIGVIGLFAVLPYFETSDIEEYNYATLGEKSDLIVSGLVVHISETYPLDENASESFQNESFSGSKDLPESYTDVTLLITSFYQGDIPSHFVTVRTFHYGSDSSNPLDTDTYHWRDEMILYLVKGDESNEYYFVLTPLGKIVAADGNYVNALNESVNFDELQSEFEYGSGQKLNYHEPIFNPETFDDLKEALDPLNKNIEDFITGSPENIPNYPNSTGVTVASEPPSFSDETILFDCLQKSDLAFYGTVNYTESFAYNPLENPEEGSMYFFTPVIFSIDDLIIGESLSSEVQVNIFGGHVRNYVIYNIDGPTPWDFNEGDKYLLYLTEKNGAYYLMFKGIYVIPD
ncbi:hypothetical protein MmiHf6_16280 [Methanimicrococcus hongohii]|uniref:Uncharacterized protein n=1 Tax=Methanimicrococcus hongohii TaxID=3028295 RepID=A0AA96V0T7_9EURY|nr:hypothetical protein [Methanimicrococcus sp. Hf6]WNY24297.1 hypothetical protein MmiHf6_16280 [Methanimicrococcus sp. Hf6]